jgi:hypothetical protein
LLAKSHEIEKKAELDAISAYVPDKPTSGGFWAFITCEGMEGLPKFILDKKNEVRRGYLPNKIEVSPEIASLLYAEKKFIDEGEQKFSDDLIRSPQKAASSAASLGWAALFPSTHSSVHAAANAGKFVVESALWFSELKQFRSKSNAVIGSIMGEYRLSKTDQGTYQLSLEDVGVKEVPVYMRSGRLRMDKQRDVPTSGIDQSINPIELPVIPSGRSR